MNYTTESDDPGGWPPPSRAARETSQTVGCLVLVVLRRWLAFGRCFVRTALEAMLFSPGGGGGLEFSLEGFGEAALMGIAYGAGNRT